MTDVRFDRPPVFEVALSVQFTTARSPLVAELAAFRSKVAEEYPNIEEHVPLARMTESGLAGIEFGFVSAPVPPRFWFVSSDSTHLVQVQSDRLSMNWRRTDDSPYPSYSSIRPRLDAAWAQLAAHLESVGTGPLTPDFAEVSYVNPIEATGATWTAPGQLSKVFTQWSGDFSDDDSERPESVTFTARYPIAGGGALYASVEPATNNTTNTPTLLTKMTARRSLDENTYDAAGLFLDVGHNAIVKTFTSMTTNHMHEHWGRTS